MLYWVARECREVLVSGSGSEAFAIEGDWWFHLIGLRLEYEVVLETKLDYAKARLNFIWGGTPKEDLGSDLVIFSLGQGDAASLAPFSKRKSVEPFPKEEDKTIEKWIESRSDAEYYDVILIYLAGCIISALKWGKILVGAKGRSLDSNIST